MPSLARELDPSSWTMCPAEAVKLDLLTVLPIQLAFITVSTLKMLELGVEIVSGYIFHERARLLSEGKTQSFLVICC